METGYHQTVLLVRNAAAEDFGGAERLVVHIAMELVKYDKWPIVISRHKDILAYATEQHIESKKGWWWSRQNWSGKNNLLLPLYLIWQLILVCWYLWLILANRADIVHLLSKDDFIAGSVAARLLGKKVIWTDCADLKYLYTNHQVWYKNPIGKMVFAASYLASTITEVCFSERQLVAQSVGHALPARYTVVYLGGMAEHVIPIERRKTDKNAVIFCATSRLVRDKGFSELIEAFLDIAKNTDSYRLWLVGDGRDRTQFEFQAKHNPHVVFWGYQTKPLPFLAASDVFVLPTYHEAFSLSLTEAAMLGKPMIATNVGGNPEVVNASNGLLISSHDVQSLLLAMQRLGANAELRAKLGRQACIDYQDKFNFINVVRSNLLPLYE